MTEPVDAAITVVDGIGVPRVGFRLDRLEVFNWGTFHNHVWTLHGRGENTLLTGDIGSGKSTLVDAITTLLVAPQKVAYNKAAGAEARERNLRSYVLGYYKSERGDSGHAARPVPLRDNRTYSVVLGRFVNEGFEQTVTLAQVFWLRDPEAPPERMYVVADEALTIKDHFADFGTDIVNLRRRLRKAGFDVSDGFPAYCTAFRRRLGIENDQALDLFNQTVSLKSVGNLTDFVRQHMLQPFAVDERIQALLAHFDNLNRAHEAVVKARTQIDRLVPLVAECERHAELSAQVVTLRACRDALQPWFAGKKALLLDARLEQIGAELERIAERIKGLVEKRNARADDRDELKRAIAANGGDRIARIGEEISRKQEQLGDRRTRAEKYETLAHSVGLALPSDADAFVANRAIIDKDAEATAQRQAVVQNVLTEDAVGFRDLKVQHDAIESEVVSLRRRRSNIPARMLALRESLCEALDLDEDVLPFAGELLQVRDDERDWEGAIERLLHGFGMSLLVADAQYASVAQWVDRTHLGGRLIYYRVRPQAVGQLDQHPASLARKLQVKPDSSFYSWVDAEVAKRFDHVCCDTMDEFQREKRAITRAGQIRGGERHEKDDRNRIDDRSGYVLGWSNEAKIAVLEKQSHDLETRMQAIADRIAAGEMEKGALTDRLRCLQQIAMFDSFRGIDWKPLAAEIHDLESERRRLESESDVLKTLNATLVQTEDALGRANKELEQANRDDERDREKQRRAQADLEECRNAVELALAQADAKDLSLFDALIVETLGERELTIESCGRNEKYVRDSLQGRIDAEDHRLGRLVEKIVAAMKAYSSDFPLDTREVDASVSAAPEYRGMLDRLRTDDLPQFERRFKELLNENTIREVANFQSQLARERQTIGERIDVINKSLHGIDYNQNRYIILEAELTTDADVRDFQQDLRACTEGALTGSEDEAYSEAKFVQVKRIIERFKGRDGTGEIDARWTRKVTDVRNWFVFSASERWRENDGEHEHYSDSGGKSGGQKEKLAYTVLAASLAYQFGLEWGERRSRTFRFVVIDEAFGRGSDESTRYGLELFGKLGLQLLIVTPLQKIHVIEPYVAAVGFVHNEDGQRSMLRNLTIDELRAERAARSA